MTTAAVRDLYDRLHDLEHTHGVTPQTLAICVLARAILALPDHAVDSGSTDRKLDLILVHVDALAAQGSQLMADIKELSDDVDTLKGNVVAVLAILDEQKVLIQALKDQIAAGGVATAADLNAIDAKVDEANALFAPPAASTSST
jgi:hypothetical protein